MKTRDAGRGRSGWFTAAVGALGVAVAAVTGTVVASESSTGNGATASSSEGSTGTSFTESRSTSLADSTTAPTTATPVSLVAGARGSTDATTTGS